MTRAPARPAGIVASPVAAPCQVSLATRPRSVACAARRGRSGWRAGGVQLVGQVVQAGGELGGVVGERLVD
ncbi:hypothetical protein NKH89_31020 [Mesorhizobium sp. M0923]|uniref:hypothetical protein n=1 Tax=unclassified Mesorhizobium TaxID=325217 RepID=UPI0012EB2929|nr:hypothetical protein [Mesorhizobium sp. LSHC420B00]